MKWTNIVESQSEEEWFEDYVRLALATRAPRLPDPVQHIGPVTATWEEINPGEAFVITKGGTGDDKILAQTLMMCQLEPHGYKQASFTFEWEKNDPLRKEADWDDVQAKAKRLVQSGNVHMQRNGPDQAQAHVIGDHDEYDTWIAFQDPNSPDVLSQWECSCPWDQYAWGRTRQWKKYEGRVCAHALATYFLARSLPKDEDAHPANQMQMPGMPGPSMPPTKPSPFNRTPNQMQAPMQQPMLPGMMPGMAVGTPPQPGTLPPQDIIPPFPMAPQEVPEVLVPNPASVPGLRQPSPTNPTQYPGGTFSKVAANFVNGQMVSTRKDDWGEWVGRSDEHGAGSLAKIPAGSPGEVMGTDPAGLVEVLFMNPATGVNEHGNMQPWGARGWFFPTELADRPDIKAPGPAIKRRR